jgi:hypothetical protein
VHTKAEATPISSNNIKRTVSKHGKGSMLTTIHDRRRVHHPQPFTNEALQFRPVDAINCTGVDGGIRKTGSNQLVIQRLHIDERHSIEYNRTTVLRMKNLATQFLGGIIIITQVPQVFEGSDDIIASIEGTSTIIPLIIARRIDIGRRLKSSLTDLQYAMPSGENYQFDYRRW